MGILEDPPRYIWQGDGCRHDNPAGASGALNCDYWLDTLSLFSCPDPTKTLPVTQPETDR